MRRLPKPRQPKAVKAKVTGQHKRADQKPGKTHAEPKHQSRQDYERTRRQNPERKEALRKYEQKRYERAKEQGLCRHCGEQAIPGQTRCESCAEKHRQQNRRRAAERKQRQAAEEPRPKSTAIPT